jgi:F-type H+-transporting ATPase subunit b
VSDWFTVLAQIVNFLILVALLKYFLYGRIVEAMERREDSIAERWNSAEEREAELQQELESANQKKQELEQQREKMMEEAREEVENYRDELTDKARQEAEDARLRWEESLQEETDAFLKDLRKRSTEQILAVVRKVLSDLSDAQLEQRIVHTFLEQLDKLNPEEHDKIQNSLAGGDSQALIQTAFEHPDKLQDQLTSKLKDLFGEELEVRYEHSDDLICGIALQTDSHKVAWDLGDYLHHLEDEIRQALEEETTERRAAEITEEETFENSNEETEQSVEQTESSESQA